LVLLGKEASTAVRNRNGATGTERRSDIGQKLRCRGYPSHDPDAERDVARLLDADTALKGGKIHGYGGIRLRIVLASMRA
jgi:hypothetical protein